MLFTLVFSGKVDFDDGIDLMFDFPTGAQVILSLRIWFY